jgi:hypothetical protein
MKTSFCPEQIDGSFIPVRRASVVNVELEGEGVLLDEVTGALYLLNSIANIIWSYMDGSSTIDELAADLSDAFSTDLEHVHRDILALVRELGRRGLLEGSVGEQDAAQSNTVMNS